jgi:hypothetical protein
LCIFFKKTLSVISIVIYIFIADSFVNEIFGDNMITPVHDTVHSLSGPLFSHNFLLKVDEHTGMPGIIGRGCSARNDRSGYAIRRWYARDAIPGDPGGIMVAGQYG